LEGELAEMLEAGWATARVEGRWKRSALSPQPPAVRPPKSFVIPSEVEESAVASAPPKFTINQTTRPIQAPGTDLDPQFKTNLTMSSHGMKMGAIQSRSGLSFMGATMKHLAALLLIAGILCSSTFASAQAVVPFKTLMQSGGAQPGVPPMQNPAAATQPPRPHMTRGGKLEMGIGIGLVGLGGVFIAGGASVSDSDWFAGETRAVGYGGGAALAGAGVTLIYLGTHRRSTK
jgi:hypothetical protein